MPAKKRTTKRKTTSKKKVTKTKGRKKTASRKTAKTTAKTAAKAPVALSTNAIKTAFSKSQLVTTISEATALSRKDVSNVFNVLGNVMHRHLKKGGARQFTVPGLMKCVVKHRPARPARKGLNPFTGEQVTFKAKPASEVVKVRPLKSLKDMVK